MSIAPIPSQDIHSLRPSSVRIAQTLCRYSQGEPFTRLGVDLLSLVLDYLPSDPLNFPADQSAPAFMPEEIDRFQRVSEARFLCGSLRERTQKLDAAQEGWQNCLLNTARWTVASLDSRYNWQVCLRGRAEDIIEEICAVDQDLAHARACLREISPLMVDLHIDPVELRQSVPQLNAEALAEDFDGALDVACTACKLQSMHLFKGVAEAEIAACLMHLRTSWITYLETKGTRSEKVVMIVLGYLISMEQFRSNRTWNAFPTGEVNVWGLHERREYPVDMGYAMDASIRRMDPYNAREEGAELRLQFDDLHRRNADHFFYTPEEQHAIVYWTQYDMMYPDAPPTLPLSENHEDKE